MYGKLLDLIRDSTELVSIKVNKKGFALVELLAVIVVISIIVTIAVPSIGRIIFKSEKEVCEANVAMIERVYEGYLDLKGLDHSNELFSQYMIDNGFDDDYDSYNYIDGRVYCSVHSVHDEEPDLDEDTNVPYL